MLSALKTVMEISTHIMSILGFFGITLVIEKIPIKLSPLTCFKNFLTKDIAEKQEQTITRIDNLEKKVDQNEMDRIRQEILSFSQLLRVSEKPPVSMKDFEHISDIYDKYHNLGGNGIITIEVDFIQARYKELRENGVIK